MRWAHTQGRRQGRWRGRRQGRCKRGRRSCYWWRPPHCSGCRGARARLLPSRCPLRPPSEACSRRRRSGWALHTSSPSQVRRCPSGPRMRTRGSVLPAARVLCRPLAVTGPLLTAPPSRVLAGGPSSTVCDALAALPGVLEARSGFTGRAGSQGLPPTSADCTGEQAGDLGLVEAIQLAVDPRVTLEALLDAFCVMPDLPGEWRGSGGAAAHPPVTFYHSLAQRDAVLRWRSRRQQTERVAVSLRPASMFWEAGPEQRSQ